MIERWKILDDVFRERFGAQDDRIAVRSPGRVNLIGEHTDYNEGFVLPAAVDKAMIFIVAPRTDGQYRFYAADLRDQYTHHSGTFARSEKRWVNYLLGILDELSQVHKKIPGCDVVFGGDIPIGAGLSSSAAVECGFGFALNDLFGLGLSKLDLAKLGQRAENRFVGVQCGIMDQFVNVFGQDRRALKIDCRALEFEYYPFERTDLSLVLCETDAKRSLASSEYNVRRQQCETGVRALQRHQKEVKSLRDATLELLFEHRREMDPVVYRRCEYVIKENERVLQACEDLRRNDFRSFGERMLLSHIGLRDDYQVSSQDLDFLVEVAGTIPGVLGARMMGAGFGGCTINLVEHGRVENFVEIVKTRYRERTGKTNNVYVTQIQSGTNRIDLTENWGQKSSES